MRSRSATAGHLKRALLRRQVIVGCRQLRQGNTQNTLVAGRGLRTNFHRHLAWSYSRIGRCRPAGRWRARPAKPPCRRRTEALDVENKANGPAVISMLRDQLPGMIPINPEGTKQSRMSAISPSAAGFFRWGSWNGQALRTRRPSAGSRRRTARFWQANR